MRQQEGNEPTGVPEDPKQIQPLLGGSISQQTGILVLAAAAAVLNRQRDLEHLLRYGLTHNTPPHNLYEALLQLYLFAGFPAALEALATFRSVVDELNIGYTPEPPEAYDVDMFNSRGQALCRTVYTTAYHKMRERVGRLSPDLDLWMVVEGYGKTLSRPGLSVDVRELVIVAVLAALGWRNQLYSHIRGAVNVGVGRADCEAVLHLVDRVFGVSPRAQAFDSLQSVFA